MMGEQAKIKFELNDERLGDQPIKVTVKFYQVHKNGDEDLDKVSVMFVRKSGDQLIWFEKYREIMEGLKVYKDATLI